MSSAAARLVPGYDDPGSVVTVQVPAQGELRVAIDEISDKEKSSAGVDFMTSMAPLSATPISGASNGAGAGGEDGLSRGSAPLGLELVSGAAEYFGTELTPGKEYIFMPGHRAAIFSWEGCVVRFWGSSITSSEKNKGEQSESGSVGGVHWYVASETPMISYLNVHALLEEQRDGQRTGSSRTPVCVIAGATDSGKSTFAQILLNYAARRGRRCIYVDLDVGQGSISIPGTVSAVVVDSPHPIGVAGDARWTQRHSAIVHTYGYTSPSENEDLYRRCVENVSRDVHAIIAENPADFGSGGIIVNTCGWVDGVGYELLVHAVETLRADSIVAIDNERLHNDLSREFGGADHVPNVKVLKLSKSGGVVPRDPTFRRNARTARIREYFYGETMEPLVEAAGKAKLSTQAIMANPALPLPFSPASTTLSFSDIVFLSVGAEPVAPLSALPIGAESTQDPLHLSEVSPSSVATLLHTVAAVSFAEKPEDVLRVNTAGFVYITDINVHRQKVTFIAPVPGSLPGKYLLVGQIKWLE